MIRTPHKWLPVISKRKNLSTWQLISFPSCLTSCKQLIEYGIVFLFTLCTMPLSIQTTFSDGMWVTFAQERVHSGSLSWLYINFVYVIPPQNVMLAWFTLVWVHPAPYTGARISLRYEISQQYHVNTKRPPVPVWNRSAGRLEQVAHAECLQFWITPVFCQHEVYLQITRYEMTQSLCKRNTK